MKNDDPKIQKLLSEKEIAKKVAELGKMISNDYKGKDVTCVCVLKGSVIFFSDLMRHLDLSVEFDFVRVSTYGNELTSQGDIKITKDLSSSILGKHVLIVEDIVDTGITISFLVDLFKSREPKSLKVCALLHKPAHQVKNLQLDYVGFTIDPNFVVGYGMDAAEKYRNLRYIGVYKIRDKE